jgi:subtilase family serine protease
MNNNPNNKNYGEALLLGFAVFLTAAFTAAFQGGFIGLKDTSSMAATEPIAEQTLLIDAVPVLETNNDDTIQEKGVVAGVSSTLPDIVLKKVSIFPYQPKVGENVSIKANILKKGKPETGTVMVQIRIDIKGDATWDVVKSVSLGTGLGILAKNIWKATEGDHRIELCVDSGNIITESDETNNCKISELIVEPIKRKRS